MIKRMRLATILMAMAVGSAAHPAWGAPSDRAAAPSSVDFSAFAPAASEFSDPRPNGSVGFPGFAAMREADQPAESAIDVVASDSRDFNDTPTAPLPPALVAGPMVILFATFLARRVNRRGGRI